MTRQHSTSRTQYAIRKRNVFFSLRIFLNVLTNCTQSTVVTCGTTHACHTRPAPPSILTLRTDIDAYVTPAGSGGDGRGLSQMNVIIANPSHLGGVGGGG
jgi:hypothetical protein